MLDYHRDSSRTNAMPQCDSPGPTTPRAASHAPAPEAWSEPCKHMLRMQPHFTCTGVYSHPQRGNHKCTPHTPVSIAHTLMGHISTHTRPLILDRSPTTLVPAIVCVACCSAKSSVCLMLCVSVWIRASAHAMSMYGGLCPNAGSKLKLGRYDVKG